MRLRGSLKASTSVPGSGGLSAGHACVGPDRTLHAKHDEKRSFMQALHYRALRLLPKQERSLTGMHAPVHEVGHAQREHPAELCWRL